MPASSRAPAGTPRREAQTIEECTSMQSALYLSKYLGGTMPIMTSQKLPEQYKHID